MVVHTCNLSTEEGVVAGESRLRPTQSYIVNSKTAWLHKETLFLKNKDKKQTLSGFGHFTR